MRPIGESIEAKHALTKLIGYIQIIQKNYNAPAEHLKLRENEFQEALAGYCYDEVKAAFKTYTRGAPDVPVVHDILIILNPPPPVFRAAMVIIIKRKIRDCQFVSPDEREYCRGYEQQELRKVEQWKQYQLRAKEPGRIASLQIEHTQLEEEDAEEDSEAA